MLYVPFIKFWLSLSTSFTGSWNIYPALTVQLPVGVSTDAWLVDNIYHQLELGARRDSDEKNHIGKHVKILNVPKIFQQQWPAADIYIAILLAAPQCRMLNLEKLFYYFAIYLIVLGIAFHRSTENLKISSDVPDAWSLEAIGPEWERYMNWLIYPG